MPLPVYATIRDVRELGGVPRGLLSNEGRLVGSALAATDIVTLNEHGFETNDPLLVRAASGGVLPAPLGAGVTYYAIKLTDSTFQLAATPGGAAINLTTDGASVVVTAPLPVERLLRLYSRWVDGVVPHLVPLAPAADGTYPDVVVAAVARLTGKALANLDGKSSDAVNAAELAAKAQLERWAAGLPVRDERITGSSNLAVVASTTAADPRGWGSGGLP